MNTAIQDKQEELAEKQEELKEKKKELQHENQKEALEQMQEDNESMQRMSRASKIIDATVENYHEYQLGNIKDLVLNPASGHIVYAVISFGGVFGLGDKLFAVPWKALNWSCDKDCYILDVDKTLLENAPGFDKEHWPDSSSEWELQRSEANQFYPSV
jgi:sporulation protein YlmC with PRC-barrel domain